MSIVGRGLGTPRTGSLVAFGLSAFALAPGPTLTGSFLYEWTEPGSVHGQEISATTWTEAGTTTGRDLLVGRHLFAWVEPGSIRGREAPSAAWTEAAPDVVRDPSITVTWTEAGAFTWADPSAITWAEPPATPGGD